MSKLNRIFHNYTLYLILLMCSALYNTLYFQPLGIKSNLFLYVAALWGVFYAFKGIRLLYLKDKKLLLALILFFIIVIVATLNNYKNMSFESMVLIGITFIYIFSVLFINNQNDFDLNQCILIFSFIVTGISLLTYVFKVNLVINYTTIGYSDRLWGIYNNPNILGSTAAISILLSLIYLNYKNPNKLFLWVNIIVQAAGLILSKSRNSIMFLCILLLIVYIQRHFKLSKRFIKTASITLGILAAVVVILIIAIPDLFNFFNRLSSQRLEVWRDSILLLMKSPFIGNGVGTMYQQFCDVFGTAHIVCADYLKSAHNLIVDVLFVSGCLGSLCLMYSVIIIKHGLNYDLFFYIVLFVLLISMLDYSFLFSNSLLSFIFWYNLSRQLKGDLI